MTRVADALRGLDVKIPPAQVSGQRAPPARPSVRVENDPTREPIDRVARRVISPASWLHRAPPEGLVGAVRRELLRVNGVVEGLRRELSAANGALQRHASRVVVLRGVVEELRFELKRRDERIEELGGRLSEALRMLTEARKLFSEDQEAW